MSAVDDVRNLGHEPTDRVATTRFINALALTKDQKAILLRRIFREMRWTITREVLIAARDFSFNL